MKLQYPSQNVYLNNGIPAYKSGEWPGIKSSKWNGSLKIVRQIREASFTNPNSHFPPTGRKHLYQDPSKEIDYKPAKRLIEFKPIPTDKPHGLRKIDISYTEPKVYPKNRISIPSRTNKELGLFPAFQRAFPEIANQRSKGEFTVNERMGRKKQINTIEERRNHMKVTSLGDKIYKCPQWSDRFFQLGGLVVGSTNNYNLRRNLPGGNNNFFETINPNNRILKEEKLWTRKLIDQDIDTQKSYVENLKDWEKLVLLEYEPDYNAASENLNLTTSKKEKLKK